MMNNEIIKAALPIDALQGTSWDACVVGNGVSALWVSHWLWSAGKSVLWITSDEPTNSERALLKHAWLWGVKSEAAQALTAQLPMNAEGETLAPHEIVYFDARSTKRFKKLAEAKGEWGAHEKSFFHSLIAAENPESPNLDLWGWHAQIHAAHDGTPSDGPSIMELAAEGRNNRYVRVERWPLIELKTEKNKITGAVLAGTNPESTIEVQAAEFYLGDFDENLPGLIKTHADSEALSAVLKGKAYRAGFGVRLWHKPLETYPSQTAIIPLVVSPEKDAGSHVIGRFITRPDGSLESFWAGFLTDEEIEDNNEILKKIKQTKRAVDRGIAGFADSITKEAVSFEPKMRASDLVKTRKLSGLGAVIFTDQFGPDVAVEIANKIFSGASGDELETEIKEAKPKAAAAPAKSSKRTREPEAAL